jgi:hypothetical protein
MRSGLDEVRGTSGAENELRNRLWSALGARPGAYVVPAESKHPQSDADRTRNQGDAAQEDDRFP